jgi:hypothetical protein
LAIKDKIETSKGSIFAQKAFTIGGVTIKINKSNKNQTNS